MAKGEKFERSVYNRLVYNFGDACVFHNCLVPKNSKADTEIDIVMLTHRAIYVIECKNYSGELSGIDTDLYWKQQTEKHKGVVKSPVFQNRKHRERLKKFLGRTSVPVISVSVLADKCSFDCVERNFDDYIVYRKDMVALLKRVEMEISSIMTSKQFGRIGKLLAECEADAEELRAFKEKMKRIAG